MKNIGALAVAIILSIIAVILVIVYLQKKETQLKESYDTVSIVVADNTIKAGERIKISDLTFKDIPKLSYTDDYILKSEAEDYKGKQIKYTVNKGSALLKSSFISYQQDIEGIPGGKVLLTISVDRISGVGGLLKKKDHVDILCTFDVINNNNSSQKLTKITKTITLLSNVLVYATENESSARSGFDASSKRSLSIFGSASKGSGKGYTNVTLELNPSEVEPITLAQNIGEITLVKRSKGDPNNYVGPGVDVTNFEQQVKKIRAVRNGK